MSLKNGKEVSFVFEFVLLNSGALFRLFVGVVDLSFLLPPVGVAASRSLRKALAIFGVIVSPSLFTYACIFIYGLATVLKSPTVSGRFPLLELLSDLRLRSSPLLVIIRSEGDDFFVLVVLLLFSRFPYNFSSVSNLFLYAVLYLSGVVEKTCFSLIKSIFFLVAIIDCNGCSSWS